MRVLGFGYTFRTVNNYAPVLRALRDRGHAAGLALMPRADDPDAKGLSRFAEYVVAEKEIATISREGLPPEELAAFLRSAIAEFDPTHILLDCTLNYPSNAVFESVASLGLARRPKVIGFQQGMYQLWYVYSITFPCDWFFCYGELHRRQFSSQRQARVVPVGLPKLDRLKEMPTRDEGWLLYVAQDTPRVEVTAMALRELAAAAKIPVKIKPHPEHLRFYDALRGEFEFLDPAADVVPFIAACSGVVTAGSTSVLEAMLLEKPVAVLPSRPAFAYEESDCVAYDFTGAALLHVLEKSRKAGFHDRFLEHAVGGRRFDSVERVISALVRVA